MHPTKPRNIPTQIFATATAIVREITYPQAPFWDGRWFGWLSPPPLGRALLLLSYWAIILAFLTNGAIVNDAYYYERIGFRAAWISVTQVPLIYLLAMKVNIIGNLSGVSYERLNWIHRWVSRTLLVTVTVHGGFFLREWVRADFVQLELWMMPMVKYGMGAWGILVWTFFSSLVPIRRFAYELFILQHLTAAGVFLWLLYVHVPSYAVYNVWLSIGVVLLDRVARISWLLYQNTNRSSTLSRDISIRMGYDADLSAVSEDITLVTIRGVTTTWKAGQHFYLSFPRISPFQSHPFTVSNIPPLDQERPINAEFVIRAHSGFTKKLYQHALLASPGSPNLRKAFISGPFGILPHWNAFETLVLISAGTGASFTLPILESVLNNPCCVQRVDFLLLVRTKDEASYYANRLKKALDSANGAVVSLQVQIAATAEPEESCYETKASVSSSILHSTGRPNLPDYIRSAVEESGGETSVAVCGGKSLTASVRNIVAYLSDDRAVHKGTGAQGIHLHVEEYCF